jgi:hypothetical protein
VRPPIGCVVTWLTGAIEDGTLYVFGKGRDGQLGNVCLLFPTCEVSSC